MFDVTACIVLYKSNPTVLKEAIDSFLNTNLNVKLFLVDNSPTDDLKNISTDNRVQYLFNPSNPGFGAAHNIVMNGIWEISRYHIVLNPDVYFEKGTIEKLYSFMETNGNVAHSMPKVLYANGDLQYLCKQNPRPFDLFARRFLPAPIKKYFKKRMENFEYRDKNYSQTIFNIPYLSGCFMFLRSQTLKKTGLFDDRIFMYIEDADLTRRILQVAETAYYPEAEIYHHYAKGSYKSWRLTWYNIQGAFIYFNKWGWF